MLPGDAPSYRARPEPAKWSKTVVGAAQAKQAGLLGITTVLHSNAALVGHPMWSQGHIHTSNMLGGGLSMVVIMSHVICNALEWFPHVGHLASLSRLLYCCIPAVQSSRGIKKR